MQTGAKWKESLLCYSKNGSGIKIWCKLIVFCLRRSSKPGGKAALCFPGGVVGRARLAAVPWEQAPPLPTARKTSRTGHFGVCPTRATSSDLGEPLTCRHGHGGPRDHAHGHAVGPGRSHGGRVDRRRDAVGLHHGGVMDDVRLRRVHRLGVVSSLLKKGKSREVFWHPAPGGVYSGANAALRPAGATSTQLRWHRTPKRGNLDKFSCSGHVL